MSEGTVIIWGHSFGSDIAYIINIEIKYNISDTY
jgi:hypothetical protein